MEGITPIDLLNLSPEARRLVNVVLRQGEMSLAEIVIELDASSSQVRERLDVLVEEGYMRVFEVHGEQHCKTLLAHSRGRDVPLNIWEALDSK